MFIKAIVLIVVHYGNTALGILGIRLVGIGLGQDRNGLVGKLPGCFYGESKTGNTGADDEEICLWHKLKARIIRCIPEGLHLRI